MLKILIKTLLLPETDLYILIALRLNTCPPLGLMMPGLSRYLHASAGLKFLHIKSCPYGACLVLGTYSCWNRKGLSPVCYNKVVIVQLSRISLHAGPLLESPERNHLDGCLYHIGRCDGQVSINIWPFSIS